RSTGPRAPSSEAATPSREPGPGFDCTRARAGDRTRRARDVFPWVRASFLPEEPRLVLLRAAEQITVAAGEVEPVVDLLYLRDERGLLPARRAARRVGELDPRRIPAHLRREGDVLGVLVRPWIRLENR